MKRRSMLAATALTATGSPLLFAGCATLNSLSAEVATYGDWPASRRWIAPPPGDTDDDTVPR